MVGLAVRLSSGALPSGSLCCPEYRELSKRTEKMMAAYVRIGYAARCEKSRCGGLRKPLQFLELSKDRHSS